MSLNYHLKTTLWTIENTTHMVHLARAQLSIKKLWKLTDITKSSKLTIKKKMRRTLLWYLKVGSNQATWEELLKLETMNIIWSWSTITTLLLILNGITSESEIPAEEQLTSSISSIWLSQRVPTTRAWSHCSTRRKLQSRAMARGLVGTVMDRTYAISKTPWRRRAVASIILWHSRFNSCMMTMKFIWLIVTHIHILTVLSFFKGYANLSQKIELERPSFAKRLHKMIVKWQLSLILVLDQKK